MFKKGRRFTAEFKEEAVRLVLVQGLSISQVARDVGASQTTISKWVAKARLDGYEPPVGESERAELQRLRNENRELKMGQPSYPTRLWACATRRVAQHGRNT